MGFLILAKNGLDSYQEVAVMPSTTSSHCMYATVHPETVIVFEPGTMVMSLLDVAANQLGTIGILVSNEDGRDSHILFKRDRASHPGELWSLAVCCCV